MQMSDLDVYSKKNLGSIKFYFEMVVEVFHFKLSIYFIQTLPSSYNSP